MLTLEKNTEPSWLSGCSYQALQRLGLPTRGAVGQGILRGMLQRLQDGNPQKDTPPNVAPVHPVLPQGPQGSGLHSAWLWPLPHMAASCPGTRLQAPSARHWVRADVAAPTAAANEGRVAQGNQGRSAAGLRKTLTGTRSAPANVTRRAAALEPHRLQFSAGGWGHGASCKRKWFW